MPFLAPFVPQIIGAGGGIAASLLGKKGQQQTSTSTPNLSPEQLALQRQLIQFAGSQLNAPTESPEFQASRNQSVTRLNKGADFAKRRLSESLADRGFGRSGLIAAGESGIEQSRLGALGNIEAQIIQFIEQNRQQQQQQRFQNALSLVPNSTGSTQTSTSRQSGFDPFQFLSPFLDGNPFGSSPERFNNAGLDLQSSVPVDTAVPNLPAPTLQNALVAGTQPKQITAGSSVGSNRLNKQAALLKKRRA